MRKQHSCDVTLMFLMSIVAFQGVDKISSMLPFVLCKNFFIDVGGTGPYIFK